MKKTAAQILAFAMSLISVFGIAGCSKTPEKTEKTIYVLYEGFVNGSVPDSYDDNPYKKLIDETFDVDYRLSVTSDLNTEIMKRYSSSNAIKPDIVVFSDYNQMRTLYDQGWYIDDYTPYLEYMPNIKPFFDSEESRKSVASIYDGDNLTCIMYPNDGSDWMYRIRRDWVAEWNAAKGTEGNPETVDELLDMARWVKRSKGEGYYLFTSAGGLKSLGYIANFQAMFSEYTDWYVDASGQINHPILDGTHKQYLDFLKTVIEEELIDPSWYTQDWGAHKTNLYSGKIGIDYYAPVLAVEYMEGSGANETTGAGIWTSLEMPTSEPGVRRQGNNYSRIGYVFAINKDNESSPERMEKICSIINDMMWQETDDITSSLYYQLRWGIGIDNYTLDAVDKENELEKIVDADGQDTGYYAFYASVNRDDHKRSSFGSLWDYGKPIQWSDKVIEYGKVSSYGQSAYDFIAMQEETQAYYAKQTKPKFLDMLSLPSKVVTRVESTIDEFEINYIKGTSAYTYEEFVQRWLTSGASSLKEVAEQQLRALGYIR